MVLRSVELQHPRDHQSGAVTCETIAFDESEGRAFVVRESEMASEHQFHVGLELKTNEKGESHGTVKGGLDSAITQVLRRNKRHSSGDCFRSTVNGWEPAVGNYSDDHHHGSASCHGRVRPRRRASRPDPSQAMSRSASGPGCGSGKRLPTSFVTGFTSDSISTASADSTRSLMAGMCDPLGLCR